MMKRIYAILAVLAISTASGWAAATPSTMSIQVKDGQLRATPSFLGKITATVVYGDQVNVLQTQGDWFQVSKAPASGWIHKSALSAKKVVLKSSAQNVESAASGEELALAGKGFNSDVEADFKSKNKNIDFTWIDRMEKITISAQEIQSFLAAGGVKGGQ